MAQDKIIETYNKLGKDYLKNIADRSPVIINDFMSQVQPKGLILDVGCAGGRDSKIFINSGFKVIGIDLVDCFLNYARENVPEGKFIKMDLLDLDFENELFDGIWANAILLHIKRKKVNKIIKKFYQILKPDGKLFIAVKEGKGSGNSTDKYSKGEERFFVYYTQKEIEKILTKNGFVPIMSDSLPSSRPGITWLRVIAKK